MDNYVHYWGEYDVIWVIKTHLCWTGIKELEDPWPTDSIKYLLTVISKLRLGLYVFEGEVIND